MDTIEVTQKRISKFNQDIQKLQYVPPEFLKKLKVGDNIYFQIKNEENASYFGTIDSIYNIYFTIKIKTVYSDIKYLKPYLKMLSIGLTLPIGSLKNVYTGIKTYDLCENVNCENGCDPKTGQCIESIPFDFNKQYANKISIYASVNQLFQQAKEYSIKPCDFYETADVLPKKSVSNSVILFDKFVFGVSKTQQDIAIKMYFQSWYPQQDNSLEVEQLVYQKVTNPLVFKGVTPHLMIYHGLLNCDKFDITSVTDPELKSQLSKIKLKGMYNTTNMYMMVLERGKGDTLWKCIHSLPDLTWENFYQPVLFQICYTLFCFEKIKFMHNDLHLDNVFIEINDEPQSFAYQVGENAWSFSTKYIVKIYDYDRSSKKSDDYLKIRITNNSLDTKRVDLTDLCSNIGQCNDFSPFVDCFNVIWNLYNLKTLNSKTKNWINSIVDEKLLLNKYSWYGIPCVCEEGTLPTWCPCDLYPFPENQLGDVLLNGFKPFSVDISNPLIKDNPMVWNPDRL